MTRILRFLVSDTGAYIRAGLCFAIAILCLSTSMAFAFQSPSIADQLSRDLRDLEVEHRFSVLETKVNEMGEDLKDLKHYDWIKMVALSGLIGEMGLRNIRRKVVRD